MIREGDTLREVDWDEAITAIRQGLNGLNPADLALLIASDSTLEEGVAVESLAAQLGTGNVDHWPRYGVQLTAPTATLTEVAQADAVVVVGADLGEEAPVVELRVLEALRGGILPTEFDHGTAIADLRLVDRPKRKPEMLAVIGKASRLSRHAGLNVEAGSDALSRLLKPDTDDLRAVSALLEKAEKPVLILGADVLASAEAGLVAQVSDLAARTGAKVLAIPAGANSLGLAALNLLPQGGSRGYAGLPDARAAFISRLDPVGEKRLSLPAGFTIVHDTHLTDTAKQADVVLPAVTNYEKRGTTVNLALWFASIGVPGLAGFIGEFAILLGAYQVEPWFAFVAGLTVIAAAAYALTAFQRTFWEGRPFGAVRLADLHSTEWLVLGLPLAAALFFGVYSASALNLLQPAVRAALSALGGQ